MSTIVPVPKKAKVTELNVIMKCFERLVKDHITYTLPDTLDPPQFAYAPIYPQTMQSLLHCTLPYPTWPRGIPI
jgi:hypothetical protein